MRINQFINTNITTSSPSFRANYFVFRKFVGGMNLNNIATDNEENLGNEPVLECRTTRGETYTGPMTYNGKYYISEDIKYNKGIYSNLVNSYRIFYKDTG